MKHLPRGAARARERALRQARLAVEFEWRVDDDAREPLAGAREGFAALPAVRVRDELDRLLPTPRPSEGFEILREANLLDVWLPELATGRGVPQNRFHAYDVYFHGLYS